MGDDYIVFGRPTIGDDEVDAVVEVLRSGWIGTGPRVRALEERFADYVGSRHAVAVSSCSAALHLALLALGLRPDDEVITAPLTFAATVHAILHMQARPVLADVDPVTMNIDPDAIARSLTPRTRALLPVHFAGRPCDMDSILEIARSRDLRLVEDAAHAIEAKYRGRKIGAIGDATCFSFYATKNMTTIEGGMLCTDSDELARSARSYALQGLSADAWERFSGEADLYDVVVPGYKYNMTDVQAALGLRQLEKLEPWLKRRRRIWEHYDDELAGLPCGTPAPEEPQTTHARHLYTLRIDRERCGIGRDAFRAGLHERGVGTGVHYRAVHTHPFYAHRFGADPGDFPHSLRIGEETVSLPLSPGLEDRDVERVVEATREVLSRRSIRGAG